MEPGPLPPHERSWRHPSELGPTRIDVDPGPRHQLAAIVTGGAMMVALAVLIVVVTPRSSSDPVAISATTSPSGPSPVAATVVAAPPAPAQAPLGVIVGASSRVFANAFTASPHAVTSSPELTLDGADVARVAPAEDDRVRVRTNAVTYELPWTVIELLQLPDGSVVFDAEGRIVAHVTRGEFVQLADD